ncbi:acylphosphatase [Evansella tamaricis]|uniref:Acylphosphatase n=1 Tax=Evansella tamaricis TaxID=2069301 RepID=A0ABS6JH05_9BACI|nr:acylphosphatase [Evansella tamaricis]MBU9712951.1 acylphosphatase [Evansella tamaricis]
MEKNSVTWLPHLTSEIVADARGQELDAYAVALEGWRRGLTLKWHVKDSDKFNEIKTWYVDKPGKLFSLSDNVKTHYFFRTRGDKVSNEAVEIGMDKEKTKRYLADAGIPTPTGNRFTDSALSDENILEYASKIGFPVVLKPIDGSYGRGVITNIKDDEELIKSITYLRTELNYSDVILEKFISGEEYRIYVVGEQVVAAIHRIPANVIGNGNNTIKDLITKKNEERSRNPRLYSCPIKINKEMEQFINKSGYSLESVPGNGETVFLTNKSNISIGGDPVDVLDIIPDNVKETAVNAVNAIPDLSHGAVDLIIEEQGNDIKGIILELNPTAQIGSLLFPMKGYARDVPAAIIDYYFPETANVKTDKEKIYFDFQEIIEPLVSRTATTVTVSAAPVGSIIAKKYIVSGEVQNIDYHRGLRKQGLERRLSGYVTNQENGNIEIVVLGIDKNVIDEFKTTITDDLERSKVYEIIEELWDEPVKVGFEVKGNLKNQLDQLNIMKLQLDYLRKEVRKAERQYKKYYRSFSWQITMPIRKIYDLFKYIRRFF